MPLVPSVPHARALSTLLVGDIHRPEFAEARGDLAAMGTLVEAATVAQAAAAIEMERFTPQVIVLAEAYPGQIGQAEVDRLRSLAPLARMIGVLGSWCEGETRTGKPWPGVLRVYWYEWGSCRRELDRLRRGESKLLSLPSTATEEERLLARDAGGTAGCHAHPSAARLGMCFTRTACRQWGPPVYLRRASRGLMLTQA